MKNTLILILLITSTFCFGQKLSEIKKQNTFFILYEEGDCTKKTIDSISYLTPEEYTHKYSYYKKKEKDFFSRYPFYFLYAKYKSHTDYLNKINETIEYRIDKKFLIRNKDILITKDFIDKIGINETVNLLYGMNKYYFLIDKGNIRNGKVLVRKVDFLYESPH